MGILLGVGVAGGLAGSAVSAYGAYEEGQATGATLDENARRTGLAARDVMQRGAADAGRVRMEGTKVIAEQKTMVAAAGIDPSVGSAADVAGQSRAMSELDAATIKNNAAREAWGLRLQAKDMKTQAKQARTAGKRAAVGAVLGGVSGAAGSLYGARQASQAGKSSESSESSGSSE